MIIGVKQASQPSRGRRQQPDRIHDLVAASHAGSNACLVCTIVYPVTQISDGICSSCRQGMGKRAASKLSQRNRLGPPSLEYELPYVVKDNVVYVDASWRDGVAGLAVVGALGAHSKSVECRSSNYAETLALQWAIKIAREAGRRDLVFRTDCLSASKLQVSQKYGWTVEWVPRRKNTVADRAAWAARLAA